jgi:hypothetical protein
MHSCMAIQAPYFARLSSHEAAKAARRMIASQSLCECACMHQCVHASVSARACVSVRVRACVYLCECVRARSAVAGVGPHEFFTVQYSLPLSSPKPTSKTPWSRFFGLQRSDGGLAIPPIYHCIGPALMPMETGPCAATYAAN